MNYTPFYILFSISMAVFFIRIYFLWRLVKTHKGKLKFDPFSTKILLYWLPRFEEATAEEYFLRKSYNMLTTIFFLLFFCSILYYLVAYFQANA